MRKPKTLTAKFVATVKEPGRYGDGGHGSNGLALNVHKMKDGRISKSWTQRIQLADRKITNLGLGRFPVITLSYARELALANRRAVAHGKDIRARGMPTFAEAIEKVIEIQRSTWRDSGSEKQWRASLTRYAAPLMARPVDQITSADVLHVLTRNDFWNAKRTTAKRVRQRIGAVCKWAIAQGHRDDDPAGAAIDSSLPKNGIHKRHHRALPYDDVGDALRRVRASDAHRPMVLALEFLTLTAARSGEVRGARWNEIDLDATTWTVPGERMKTGREHRVPLSDRAIEVLHEAKKISGDDGLIFETITGKQIAATKLSAVLRDCDVESTVHGFRSSFRCWTAERTSCPREVCEAALAHTNGNAVEAAYQRSDLFAKRAELMNAWADFVTA